MISTERLVSTRIHNTMAFVILTCFTKASLCRVYNRHVLQIECHGCSYEWFQLFGIHNLTRLLNLGFPISGTQFLIVNSIDYCCYHFCAPVSIIVFLFFQFVMN